MATTTQQQNMPKWQQIIKERKLDISVIKTENLGLNQRLDAESYRPLLMKNLENIQKKDWEVFDNLLLEITGGATPLGANYLKSGIPFVRVQNVMQNYFNLNDLVYISNKDDYKIKRSRLNKDDVMLTITGVSYGKAATVQGDLIGANMNQHSVRMKFEKISPFYVSTFLNAKPGKLQSDQNIVGLSRPALDYQAIKQFKIPIPSKYFQEKIAEFVSWAHAEQKQSKKLYAEAEDILLEELGLKDWQPTEKNTAVKDSEKVRLFGRVDAEFFQPKYDQLFEKLEEVEVKNLGEIVVYSKGVEPGSKAYTEKGIPFVRVSNVSIQGIDKVEKKISKELFEKYKNSYSPKKGEILFTKDGTIGISFVVNEDLKVVLSGAFLRLIPQIEIEKEYLALVLNSIVCRLQIERFAGGAIIAHLKPSDAMNLQIPILSESMQTQISEKIKASHAAREKSKTLLENAKRAVEIFVEKDEKTAEDFLSKTKNT